MIDHGGQGIDTTVRQNVRKLGTMMKGERSVDGVSRVGACHRMKGMRGEDPQMVEGSGVGIVEMRNAVLMEGIGGIGMLPVQGRDQFRGPGHEAEAMQETTREDIMMMAARENLTTTGIVFEIIGNGGRERASNPMMSLTSLSRYSFLSLRFHNDCLIKGYLANKNTELVLKRTDCPRENAVV